MMSIQIDVYWFSSLICVLVCSPIERRNLSKLFFIPVSSGITSRQPTGIQSKLLRYSSSVAASISTPRNGPFCSYGKRCPGWQTHW